MTFQSQGMLQNTKPLTYSIKEDPISALSPFKRATASKNKAMSNLRDADLITVNMKLCLTITCNSIALEYGAIRCF